MSEEILVELRAIRAEQQSQAVTLGRVDERVLTLDKKMSDHLAADKEFHDKTDGRVGALEHWRTRAVAVVSLIGIAVAFVATGIRDALAAMWANH